MPITTLLSGLPNQSMEQAAFDAAVAKLMTDLPTWGAEANALTAGLNSIAAGGGFSAPYTFSTTITDADPGAGVIRLSSATQNASTVMRVDLTSALGQDLTAMLDSFAGSTSTIKGQVRLVKMNDPTKWLAFNLTATASPSGYRNFTVAHVAGGATSPFANNDSLALLFTRNGDKGDTGATGASGVTVLHVREERASGTVASAGTAAALGFRRPLNTVKTNGIAGASLASDQVVLPAGTYNVRARTAAIPTDADIGDTIVSAKLFLRNITDSTYAIIGLNSSGNDLGSLNYSEIEANLVGQITIAAPKTFEIWHYMSRAFQLWGRAASTGQVEVYTEAFFEKVG